MIVSVPSAGGDVHYPTRDSQRVWVLTLERPQVVFHDLAYRRRGQTDCGLSTLWHWQNGDVDQRGVFLRLYHALKIGRPCGRCWP